MPDLSRFAAFGRSPAGSVPPVPPAADQGGTGPRSGNYKAVQPLKPAVPLVPPVPPEKNDAAIESDPGKAVEAADVLEIEARAKRRLADEYDAAQERGEVAGQGRANLPDGKVSATVADIGLTHKQVHEARQLRDAETADPGVIRPGWLSAAKSSRPSSFRGGTGGTGGTREPTHAISDTYERPGLFHLQFVEVEQVEQLDRDELRDFYEERAAIREFDGEMSRPDAELAAAQDLAEAVRDGRFTPSSPQQSVDGADTVRAAPALSGLVGEWQRALAGLDREYEPCPGPRRWPAVYRAADDFLTRHAEQAVALGWDELTLFGVHRRVGTIRGDCSGALMLSGGQPVVSVTADTIRFTDGLAYRRHPWPQGERPIPVWEFGR